MTIVKRATKPLTRSAEIATKAAVRRDSCPSRASASQFLLESSSPSRINGRLSRGPSGTSTPTGSRAEDSRFATTDGVASMTASVSPSGRTRLTSVPGTGGPSMTFSCCCRVGRTSFSVRPPALISTIRSLRAAQSVTLSSTTHSAFGCSRTENNPAISAVPFAPTGTASPGRSTHCTSKSSSSPRKDPASSAASSPGAGHTCRINSKESAITESDPPGRRRRFSNRPPARQAIMLGIPTFLPIITDHQKRRAR